MGAIKHGPSSYSRENRTLIWTFSKLVITKSYSLIYELNTVLVMITMILQERRIYMPLSPFFLFTQLSSYPEPQ